LNVRKREEALEVSTFGDIHKKRYHTIEMVISFIDFDS